MKIRFALLISLVAVFVGCSSNITNKGNPAPVDTSTPSSSVSVTRPAVPLGAVRSLSEEGQGRTSPRRGASFIEEHCESGGVAKEQDATFGQPKRPTLFLSCFSKDGKKQLVTLKCKPSGEQCERLPYRANTPTTRTMEAELRRLEDERNRRSKR